MKRAIGITLLSLIALTGIGYAENKSTEEQDFLKRHQLDNKTVQERIEYLDQLENKRTLSLNASVRSDKLFLSDNTSRFSQDIDGLFYLSFAPYITRTHECYYHNLISCQGELVKQKFSVKITDDAGNTLVNEEKTSYANGFIGVWLPRNIKVTLEVQTDGFKGSQTITTDPQSPTCVTTLKLEKKS